MIHDVLHQAGLVEERRVQVPIPLLQLPGPRVQCLNEIRLLGYDVTELCYFVLVLGDHALHDGGVLVRESQVARGGRLEFLTKSPQSNVLGVKEDEAGIHPQELVLKLQHLILQGNMFKRQIQGMPE